MKKIISVAVAMSLLSVSPLAISGSHGDNHDHKDGHKKYKEKKVDKKIKRLDSDGNGKISYDEFLADSIARFNQMDLDGDREVTSDELQQYKIQKKSKKKLEKVNKRHEKFKEMDQDGDSKISFDELEAHKKAKKAKKALELAE